MRIVICGKFTKLHDEEYIARSFEALGHEVARVPDHMSPMDALASKPDILMYCKYEPTPLVKARIEALQRAGMKTICWLFDIYFNYTREYQVRHRWFFKSDYVFTTDGGNQERFEKEGVNHHCIRQGIYDKECILYPFQEPEHDVVFVGSDNPVYPERRQMFEQVSKDFKADWLGRKDTDEVRGLSLNELFSKSKIVIGDSFPSAHYWSNRVVETLGRGGFLIHREVEGLKEEYPDLVTYDGTYEDLKKKIEYYLTHEEERLEIVRKNFEFVKKHYIMINKCKELLSQIK